MGKDKKGSKTEDVRIATHHKIMVNNQSHADVILQIGKRNIFAHNCVLSARCPKLISSGKGGIPKKKKGIITKELHPNTNEAILLEFLTYIYTEEVAFDALAVPEILLLNAAAMANDMQRLQWLCENHLKDMLTTDNSYDILVEAHRAKQNRVKDIVLHFAVANYNTFVGNKAGTQKLGIELFQDAVTVYQQSLAGELKPLKEEPCPPDMLLADFKAIYQGLNEGKDPEAITFFKVGSVLQQFIPAHKSVLAQTAQLEALCNQQVQKGPPEHIIVPPLKTRDGNNSPNISSDAFTSMLEYIYYCETNIPPLHAVELIPWTVDYNMPDLQKVCYDIIEKNIEIPTALPILGVSYLAYDQLANFQHAITVEKIRKESTAFIVSHLSEINFSKLGKMAPQIAVDIVLATQAAQGGLPTELPKEKSSSGLKSKEKTSGEEN